MRLRSIRESSEHSVPTPDDIYTQDPKAKAFIFTGQEMYYGSDTHMSIMHNHWQALTGSQEPPTYDDKATLWRTIQDRALLGRVGECWPGPSMDLVHAVAFWNDDKLIYNELLGSCISHLAHDGLLEADSVIYTPFGKHDTTAATAETVKPHNTEIDRQRQQDMELLRQLHLMPAGQKKAALKRLGAPGGKKSPWQAASEKAGVVQPGHKWWAPTSESKLS